VIRRAIREHGSDETSPSGFVRSRFGHFNTDARMASDRVIHRPLHFSEA
jgi:hypothetical protein